ncbi:hypothetical protein BKA63DRAFT_486917 [Paraphoma chrysanthemicola]|nr:hypothetical protein BKA63DRAFT_486917 [Paraphoma chrysanthemicola]
MSSWYCCKCGDGPHSLQLVGSCTSCGHVGCGACTVEDAHYSRPIGSLHLASASNFSIGSPTTASIPIPTIPTTAADSISYYDETEPSLRFHASHSHGHSRESQQLYTRSRGAGQPLQQQEGAPVQYRWTCCNCHYNNSYEYDAGCSNCNNHWREACGGCSVFATR